jgi:carbon monoxide dehydrogenase subunit G
LKPSIQFDDEMTLPMSRERAWELLTDPEVVVSCVPGAEVVDVDSDGTIRGRLTLSLGPSATRFEGRIVPTFDHDAYSGELTGQGSDGRGRTRAAIKTSFHVEEQSADSARFLISSEIAVSGALAGFATAGGQAVATRLLTDFSENLSQIGRSGLPEVRNQSNATQPQRLGIIGLLLRTAWDAIRRLFRRSDDPK